MRSLFFSFIHSFRHRGVQVVSSIILYLLLSEHLPIYAHRGFYTISLCIKDLLIWMLPFTVGFFIADTMCTFERKAPLFIGSLLLFEALSNCSSVWYAFATAHLAAHSLPSLELPSFHDSFSPLWRLELNKPGWWSADKGTIAGIVIGFFGAMFPKSPLRHLIRMGRESAQWILTHLFAGLIPIFVLGFVARMVQSGFFYQILLHYGELLIWLVFFLAFYLLLLFFIGSSFSFFNVLRSIKNLLPAGSFSFCSGCSLSTMPLTIEGTAKNLQHPSLAKAIIPATTNIQQVGDCITNAFLCFLLYQHFFGHSPDVFTWLQFSLVFVLARFTTAAVLGGAIFIMLPIYETYLSFNAEMIAIVLAFNVILDSLVTSTNVLGNGALCAIFEKVWLWVLQKLEMHTQGKELKSK